jgi:AraC-like DNA-binding protein
LTIHQDKINNVINYLNEFYPLDEKQSWKVMPEFFHLYNTPDIASLVNKLFGYITSGDTMKDVLVDLTFKELFVKIYQSQSLLSLDLGKYSNTALVHVKEFIKSNITEKLTLDLLQKVTNMSKPSLIRMFKRELGISPVEYIIRMRIDKAKQLLVATKSVKESCFAAGFNDVNYFVRLFKNREGVTPGNYLQLN